MLEVDIRVARRLFEVAAAFTVAGGQRLALFGPSGSGKTTVLEAIAGLAAVSEGRIILGGRELTSVDAAGRARQIPVWAREVALLRQDPGLFPHLNVGENLTYGAGRRDGQAVVRLVETLGLQGLLGASPRRISGGQAQRVALGRALLSGHRALLLDEPHRGLDVPLRRELTELVRDQVGGRGVPAVLVTHELDEAQAFADHLGVLDRGRLLQLGSPSDVVRQPASPRVAELVGYRGLVAVTARGRPMLAAVHPERVRLGARPERGPVVEGRVLASRPAGAGWVVDVAVGPEMPPPRADRPGAPAFSFRLSDPPLPPGAPVVLTLLDPPLFEAPAAAAPPAGGVRSDTVRGGEVSS
jgi:molybdate transport system ATP-binding protein